MTKNMAEKVIVKAEKREDRGKNVARRLRGEGKIPIVVYGGGGESVAASAALADLAAVLRSDSGQNTVFSLDIAGVGESDVIFQDRQIDAIKGRLIHADLRRLVKGEKIEMTVPIHLVGEPIGVKEDGGLLEQQMREIKILCEPANAPDAIDVDVSGLHLNESAHVSDLTVDEGIEIHAPADAVIASVVYVKEVVLEPQVEEGAEPVVEGEESAAETAAEPEAEGGE
jgi:large subunit ribosomal protein L25